MDDEKLIEAVARVICKAAGLPPDKIVESADYQIEGWKFFEDEARAAIAVVVEEWTKVAAYGVPLPDWVDESGDERLAEACHDYENKITDAIRALAAPRVEQETKP